MTGWLQSLSDLIQSAAWFAPILALLAGVLTSFTPCSLTNVPLVIGYVGSTEEQSTRRAFALSVTFVLGNALTFTILGVLATLAGRMLGAMASWWYIALGILMVLMALQTWGVITLIPSGALSTLPKSTGYVGAFAAGVLGGVFSTPCATPVLVALMAVVAGGGNLAWGVLLFLLYSIGHGALAILAGTSVGFAKKLSASESYESASRWIKGVLGLGILLIGFYMLYLGF